jgi:glycosyltransferase involved in cell wall biosynthesis
LTTSKMEKLISVCIPTYGRSVYLQAAIRSVLEQDHRPLEILVGDDSPNAENHTFIASLPRDEGVEIRYVPNETRLGQASNVNRLLKLSRGGWIVILHDDDFILPGGLSRLFEATRRHPDAVAAFGLQAVMDKDGIVDWEASAASNRDFGRTVEAVGPQTSKLASAVSGQFPNNAFLLKGEIARQVLYNGYDDVKDACDYDFGIRVAIAPVSGTFVLIDDYVSAYRVWGAQISKASSTGIAALRLLKALKPQTPEEMTAIWQAIARHVPIAVSEHARAHERMASLKLLLSPSYWESSRLPQALYHIMLIVSPGMVRNLKTRLRS